MVAFDLSNFLSSQVGVLVAGASSAVLELTVPVAIGTVPLKHTLPPGMQRKECECILATELVC